MDLPAEVDSGLTVEVRASVQPLNLLPHLLSRSRLIASSDAQDATIGFASPIAVRFSLPWAAVEATQDFVRFQVEGPDRYEAAMDLIQALTVGLHDQDDVAIDHVRSIGLTVRSDYSADAMQNGSGTGALEFLINDTFSSAIDATTLNSLEMDIQIGGSTADRMQLVVEPASNDDNFSASARFVWDRSGEHRDETPLLRAQKEWSDVLGTGTEAIRTIVEHLVGESS